MFGFPRQEILGVISQQCHKFISFTSYLKERWSIPTLEGSVGLNAAHGMGCFRSWYQDHELVNQTLWVCAQLSRLLFGWLQAKSLPCQGLRLLTSEMRLLPTCLLEWCQRACKIACKSTGLSAWHVCLLGSSRVRDFVTLLGIDA